MISDFRKKKLNALFKLYDWDGDRVLARSDFDAVGRAYAKALNAPPDGLVFDGVVELETKAWDEIRTRCDANDDGKISQEEFAAGVESWLNDRPSFERYVVDFCDRVFNVIDRNGDNKIDEDEYLAFSYTVDRERGSATFKRMDIDGSGYLSKGELIKHYLDFYYSDDPEAPGNGLWGINV